MHIALVIKVTSGRVESALAADGGEGEPYNQSIGEPAAELRHPCGLADLGVHYGALRALVRDYH